MSWTAVADALPFAAERDRFYAHSEPVLVSDGCTVEAAYLTASNWDGEKWELSWRQPGRDSYSLTFEPTHWRPMPAPPETSQDRT